MARLIEELKKLPGVGTKSAQRYAFHILRSSDDDANALAEAVRGLKARLRLCSVCNNVTDIDPCAYCASPTRNQRLVCVVEEPTNIAAVERSQIVPGRLPRAAWDALSAAWRWTGPVAREDSRRPRGTWRSGRSDSGDQPHTRGRSYGRLAGNCIAQIFGQDYANSNGRSRRQRHRIRR